MGGIGTDSDDAVNFGDGLDFHDNMSPVSFINNS
jgi:hypothetical protein